MKEWNYGGACDRHPIREGQTAVFDNGSMVKVHNIFDPLPNIMINADLLFIDPPWNLGNLNSFYTKADRADHQKCFENFYNRLFACIREIQPKICYVEVGKEYLAEFIIKLKEQYNHVTFYNSTYYKKKDNFCYVIRACNKNKKLPLNNLDEEDIIKWVCENEDFNFIGDLCMGRGLVGRYAYENKKKFVGTELNHKRLSVLLEKIVDLGGKYEILGGSK